MPILAIGQVHNDVVDELDLNILKQLAKLSFEATEEVLNHLSLHFWRELLVKVEFFNQGVEVSPEGPVQFILDRLIKLARHFSLVCLLEVTEPDSGALLRCCEVAVEV